MGWSDAYRKLIKLLYKNASSKLDNSFGKEIMKNNLSKNFLYFDFYEVNIVWNPLEYWDFTFDKSFMENICFP